jgi:hypothetical protein
MPKIHLFSNTSGKVTTRVVPLRFSRATPSGDVIQKGYPPIDERDVTNRPTVGATADADAPSSFRVQVTRQMLGDDAPLVVLPSNQLSVASSDAYRPPHDHSFELEITPKPSVKDAVTAEVVIRWGSSNDAVLARLSVRCYPPIKLQIAFFRVGTKSAHTPDTEAQLPDVLEDDIFRYLDVINAIYAPAGIVFTGITRQIVMETAAGPGGLVEGTELVLLFRAGNEMLQKETPGGRFIMVFLVDKYKSTVQGQGVSPRMASGTAGVYVAEDFGDLFPNGIDSLFNAHILPRKMQDADMGDEAIETDWCLEANIRLWADMVGNPRESVSGNPGNMVTVSRAENRAKAIVKLHKRFVRFGVLYDPEGKIINAFTPANPPTKLVFRHYLPGVLMASTIVGDEGPPLASRDYLHWGRAIAHEIGHYCTLFHPGDPAYLGQVKADDVWSRGRLMYSRGRFPPKTISDNLTTAVAAAGAVTPIGVITAPILTTTLAGTLMDLGYGNLEPGILLTHTQLQYGGVTLDPAGGEVETLRGVAATLAGGTTS